MSYQTIDLQEFKTKVIPIWERNKNYNVSYTIIIQGKPVFQVNPFENQEKENNDFIPTKEFIDFREEKWEDLPESVKRKAEAFDRGELTFVNL